MLKLTTDKHEASRGLSATAELLVFSAAMIFFQSIWNKDTTRFQTYNVREKLLTQLFKSVYLTEIIFEIKYSITECFFFCPL